MDSKGERRPIEPIELDDASVGSGKTSIETRSESGASSPTPSDRSTSSSESYRLSDGEIGPKTTITTPDGNELTYVKKLEGRGQDTFAGIFEDQETKIRYLIKVDDPGVCLAEATATNQILPENARQALNCATIGCLEIKGESKMISIQDLVTAKSGETVMPLDTIVYGEKRTPKAKWSDPSTWTLKSPEFRNQEKISEFLNDRSKITLDAKKEFAYALFARTALGDESIHLGQYMAIVDDNKCVVGIRAIDLGARERYAAARNEKNQIDPSKTSTLYTLPNPNVNAIGRDYLTILLQEPELHRMYLEIWSNASPDDMTNIIIDNFQEQLDKIPDPEDKKKTLDEFLEEINSNASEDHKITLDPNASIEDNIQHFLSEYKDLISIRSHAMQAKAQAQLKPITDFEKAFSQLADDALKSKKLLYFVSKINQVCDKKDRIVFPAGQSLKENIQHFLKQPVIRKHTDLLTIQQEKFQAMKTKLSDSKRSTSNQENQQKNTQKAHVPHNLGKFG